MNKQSSFSSPSDEQTNIYKEPIAIVGIGCRFPGNVNNPEEFWHALKNSFDAITDVPEDLWNLLF